MMDENPWLVLIGVWRNTLLAFVRLPVLILGCWLLYTALSGYWFHDFPINIPRGFLSQAGYMLLHGLAFGPLIAAVIQSSTQPTRQLDIWRAATLWLGAAIVFRELAVFGLTALFHAGRDAMAYPLMLESRTRAHYIQLGLLYWFSYLSLTLTIFLLSVRLILLLPILAVEGLDRRGTLAGAWQAMRGNYVFALTVSFAALLPMVVVDRFLGRLYRSLSVSSDLSVPLSYREWEALMVRSAELTVNYVLIAALAAGLYLAIRAADTGPSLSNATLARAH